MRELVTIRQADLKIGDVLHLSGDVLIDGPVVMGDGRVWIDVVSLEPPVMRPRDTGGPRELEGAVGRTVVVERPADDDLPYSAPGGHVSRGGVPAARATNVDVITRMAEWYRDGAHFSMPEVLLTGVIPDDIQLAAFRAACRWINAESWEDDDPDRIAAERMTVDEVIACIFMHYPHGDHPWEYVLEAAAALA
ncbi:MAG TPA: hypothetical protein VGL36_35640 [Kribbella sp.]